MNWREYTKWWEPDLMRRWPSRALDLISLPESEKRFLGEIGLPVRDEQCNLTFPNPEEGMVEVPGRHGYRILGYNGSKPICIDESRGGRLILVEPAAGTEERTMNMSVSAFAECLALYKEYLCIAGADPSKEPDDYLVDRLEPDMRAFDSSALKSEDTFWSLIIEQLRHGLL